MSLDNKVDADGNPYTAGNDAVGVDGRPPKKSGGALKWILGGCGCLGLMALICFGVVGYFGASMAGQITQEATAFIEGSTRAQEYLGNPITINGEPTPSQNGQGDLVFDFDVSGPKASGTATVTAKMNPESFKFEIEESILNVNGETIDLNAKDEFKEPEVEGLDF